MRRNVYSVPNRSLTIEEEIMTNMLRISNRFRRNAEIGLRNYGLTLIQYNVLRILADSGNGQNTMGNINKMMLFSKANMTGLAKRLEKNGFVIIKRDDFDDRLKLLEITPRGKQRLGDIYKEALEHLNSYLEDFSDNEKSELNQMVFKIIRRINSMEST
jgi:DNA-binding MarR family transcriptional regulator